MQLTEIVTLANDRVRLRFTAMERSLRAVGCDLPLRVIPYDDQRFELPPNATWWDDHPVFATLTAAGAHRMMRKYACLTIANYQFVDSDVVFLRNPAEVLGPCSGWIASCGAWRNPTHTLTPELANVARARSSLFQRDLFNAGQFASDRSLYDPEGLIRTLTDPRYSATTLTFPYHDQPGLNLLVQLADPPLHNLTLPPHRMESTWAGDYPDADFNRLWTNAQRTPYLMHWAGCDPDVPRPIDELYLQYLMAGERDEWHRQVSARRNHKQSLSATALNLARRFRRASRQFGSVISTGQTLEQRDQGNT